MRRLRELILRFTGLFNKELWRFPWPYGVNVADPIVSGDTIFVSSGYGKGAGLIRFGGASPSLVWTNT